MALFLAPLSVSAGVTILGAQYVPDQYFPEFDCYWNASAYPGPCRTPIRGATMHLYFKNTGASSVTINDLNFTTASSTYSLKTIIKKSTGSYNPDELNNIYFYWDNPPQDVLDAGEPAWYRFDPPTVAPGGVGRAAVRLRRTPLPASVGLEVVTSGGNGSANVSVDANTPRVASIGYSDDLQKVYVHWRRSGGAAPVSVWLDGANVTAQTTTVGDPAMNFGASAISLASPLSYFSYHVFQGVYADGKTATASQRAWTNKFIYCTYSTFSTDSSYTASDWVAEASDHGFNNVQMNLGAMGSYLGTSAGRADCVAHGYGYTILDKTKLNALDPDMFFLNDEPDAEENNQGLTHCGTGYKIPCDSSHYPGSLVIKTVAYGESELRSLRPNVPFVVNLDGAEEPESFFTWGPAMDVLQTDNYYEPRLTDAYVSQPNRIPLYTKAKLSYAVARTCCAGAEPNPSHHLLYCNKDTTTGWPYPFTQSKRFECYYSLAGGSKGLGYWWLNSPEGMNNTESASLALWKEVGLVGNEMKTARPLIVKSTPVDITLTPSANVWTKALASGIDSFIVVVVNDNYLTDESGCHVTNVPNATVTATLPSWMQASPTAFEITAGGLRDVSATPQGGGSQFQLNLGTLQLTRLIIVTTDPLLRTSIQQRYDTQVRSHVCNFAPEQCVNTPPGITQQPSNQSVATGGTASFTTVASGSGTLSYRWQKNTVNLNNGGHYSGATTGTLTITGADSNDVASYRCVVTNAYGSATSSSATLSLVSSNTAPTITQQPANQSVSPGATASFAVSASGSGTLSYQWQKNTIALSNAGHYAGVTTTTLTISTADDTDAANYRCVVTNAYGSATSASASLTINNCVPSTLLGHGDMEDSSSYSVCPDWASYSAGNGTASFNKETATIHGGLASQQCHNSNGGAGSLLGVRQTVDANVGDAFTFEGWVNPVSNPGAGQQVAMSVRWDGSTANPATNSGTWNISSGARNVWTHLTGLAGNATATQVTLFLDSRRTSSSQDLTAYWDDILSYRAYVPPAPQVSAASGASLNVDVQPGCNQTNGAAEYAISIGGGGYTLGTHWVQANGTVSTAAVWQSDGAWGSKTVTGLTTGTAYTFKVEARYSSAHPQPTSLGAGASAVPQGGMPPTITQQPAVQSVCPGDTAVFTVAATSTNAISYQWQQNDANLSNGGGFAGVTTASLTVSGADASDAANYRCVVSDSGGSTNSSEAALTVKADTIVTDPPAGQTVRPGDDATFSVSATGEGALSYQWQTNGVNIADSAHYSGCTTPTLTVSNAGSADEVSYRCVVTGGCGSDVSSEADLTLATGSLGLVTLSSIPTLSGDTANEARAITPDGRWAVGLSGSRGFLYAVGTTNAFNALSSDSSQATVLTGVGYRIPQGGTTGQIVMSGLNSSGFGAWMIPQGGSGVTWGVLAGASTGKKPTVPLANGLAGTTSDAFFAIWTDEGTGASDNWTLNVGRFSNAWPATVFFAPKAAAKPDTLQVNGIASNGRAVGWRRNGTTLVYANYVADYQGLTTPAVWNFNGLDGTTAGQALAVNADGTAIFGISPKGAATGTTNFAYKARFNATFPGAATQLSIAPLPNFPDTAGTTNLAVPYGCTPDGAYAVGLSYRGMERAVLWDTSQSDPGQWTVVDLTEIASANGILTGFARLSRAYSVGTDNTGALVIAGAGVDTGSPTHTRGFVMTVSPPIAPIAFPPTITSVGLSPSGFACSFLSLANPNITYYLEYTTDLTPPASWTAVASTPGTGAQTVLSDPNPPGTQGFYRVRIQ
jgi:hypothetical protein